MADRKQVLDFPGLELRVRSDGSTEYIFADNAASRASESSVTLTTFPHHVEKGLGVVTHNEVPLSTIVTRNRALGCTLTGSRRHEICHNCYCHVRTGRTLTPPASKLLYYCSQECMKEAKEYIRAVAPSINAITADKNIAETHKESQLLALQVLHHIATEHTADALSLLLESFHLHHDLGMEPDSVSEEVATPAKAFHSLFLQHFPASLLSYLKTLLPQIDTVAFHCTLFRIIRLNAQTVFYHTVNNVFLLMLLPTLARINHSCVPNCSLLLEFLPSEPTNATEASLVVPAVRRRDVQMSLIAISNVPAQTELTVSYLQDACHACDLRRDFLRMAFGFNCRCEKCLIELADSAEARASSDGGQTQKVSEEFSQPCLVHVHVSETGRFRQRSSLPMLFEIEAMTGQLNLLLVQHVSRVEHNRSSFSSSATASRESGGRLGLWALDQCHLALDISERLLQRIKDLQKSEGVRGVWGHYLLYSADNRPLSSHLPASTSSAATSRPFVWSPGTLHDVALLILQDFTTRFLSTSLPQLGAQHAYQYLQYGLCYLRSVSLQVECLSLAGAAVGFTRLDFMITGVVNSGGIGKTYLDRYRSEVAEGVSSVDQQNTVRSIRPATMVTALKRMLSLVIELLVVVDTVYLTAHNSSSRPSAHLIQQQVQLPPSAQSAQPQSLSLDSWTHLHRLRAKAEQAKHYLKTLIPVIAALA